MSTKANYKAFEAAAAELSISQIGPAIEHLKTQRANTRAATKEQKAILLAQVAELTERRNRTPKDDAPKERKSKKSKKAEG